MPLNIFLLDNSHLDSLKLSLDSLRVIAEHFGQEINELKSPQTQEGQWYYFRVFGPIIGAFLAGLIAIIVFWATKTKEKKNELERLNIIRELILYSCYYTKRTIVSQMLHMNQTIEMIKEYYEKKQLNVIFLNVEYFVPATFETIKKNDALKVLINSENKSKELILLNCYHFINSPNVTKNIYQRLLDISKKINEFQSSFRSIREKLLLKILYENNCDLSYEEKVIIKKFSDNNKNNLLTVFLENLVELKRTLSNKKFSEFIANETFNIGNDNIQLHENLSLIRDELTDVIFDLEIVRYNYKFILDNLFTDQEKEILTKEESILNQRLKELEQKENETM